jgi:signal transduction histidine kinase
MRDNISRDLHDDIGSSLTNIAIMNELAREEIRRGGDMEKILSKSAEDIHEMISSLSDIVWNVNPEFDDLSFLIARMRRYASELLDNAEIDYTLDFPESEQKILMNMAQRRDLYLVFKEGLNNLVKYSGASHAEIRIKISGGDIFMKINDDGRGFEMEKVNAGNGLKNMRQRTEAWNGKFTIISRPGQGTELNFMIPIEN